LKLAALFSGGKDSTYAIHKAKSEGHDIVCLVSIFPKSEESHLLHYPNMKTTALQAKAMKIPHLVSGIDSDDTQAELDGIYQILQKAKKEFGIQGVVHGGILSNYQKNHFENISTNLDLQVISPLWKKDQKQYLSELLKSKFKFIITSVTTAGLDDSWLGKEIMVDDITKLSDISSEHGLNVSFEGGEAETLKPCSELISDNFVISSTMISFPSHESSSPAVEAILDQ